MSVDKLLDYNLINLVFVLIPLFVFLAAIEMLVVYVFKFKQKNDSKEWFLNVFLGVSSFPINASFGFITIAALFWAKSYQIYTLPFTLPVLVVCFILDDFRFYLHHRIVHRWRWGWGLHRAHHTSERFALDVGARQPWTKHFTGTMMLKVPLVLIGFDPIMVLFCGFMNAYYQFLLHTQTIKKLPSWYEYIFNTPSHHRVHHGKNPKYLDANYAGTLIIWDRMLGTFVAEDENDLPDYGLVDPLDTYNPVRILFGEYWNIVKDVSQKGINLKSRFMYLFGPPGWSHDGSRKTSTDIKADYYRALKNN